MDLVMPSQMYANCSLDGLLWRISKTSVDENVQIDLGRITFIRPESIILLIVLSLELFNRTKVPIKWININCNVHSYLDRMEINNLDFIEIPSLRKQLRWNRPKNESFNLTELLTVKQPKDCETVIRHLKEMIIKWFPDKVGHDYCRTLPALIAEIANNSLEHSQAHQNGVCYLVAQKYSTSQSTKIVVAMGDAGMGIRQSLSLANDWIANNDLYCIKKAFFEGASCREDRSGGLGFQRVKSILQQDGGEVVVRSGSAVVTYNPKISRKPCNFRESLAGTQTTFIL